MQRRKKKLTTTTTAHRQTQIYKLRKNAIERNEQQQQQKKVRGKSREREAEKIKNQNQKIQKCQELQAHARYVAVAQSPIKPSARYEYEHVRISKTQPNEPKRSETKRKDAATPFGIVCCCCCCCWCFSYHYYYYLLLIASCSQRISTYSFQAYRCEFKWIKESEREIRLSDSPFATFKADSFVK